MNKEQAIKKVKSLYTGINSYLLKKNDPYNKLKEHNKNDVIETYGEILPKGVNEIINNISIDKNDVFFDLGCCVCIYERGEKMPHSIYNCSCE